jgi:hypothetical protein
MKYMIQIARTTMIKFFRLLPFAMTCDLWWSFMNLDVRMHIVA